MTTRHRVIAAAACIGAFVLVIVPLIWGSWQPAPQPVPTPMPIHGKFADRLQPKLDGIGSTRELAPVPPDGAQSPRKTAPSHPRRGQDR